MPLPSADPSTADPPASDRVGPRRLNRIGVKLVVAVAAILAVQVAVRSYVEYQTDA
ncbi:MAG: hypothetical protein ISS74_10510, partial [Planctomycetes bacterium]|nr:hypothetical protein [Planctomycetota bacterium]